MPSEIQQYKDFKHGVVNAIEVSEIPVEAVYKAQNFYYRENWWRKLPGFVEINPTTLGTDPVWGLVKWRQLNTGKVFVIATSGGNVYNYDEGTKTFSSIYTGLVANQPIEFYQDRDHLYFGSDENPWRMFDGGVSTYPIGKANAPKKFSRILYGPYAGRYFGIGNKDQRDGLYYSEHIDNGGINQWTAAPQLMESVKGDYPLALDIYEGRLTTASEFSISSGTVVGVPESWSFDREKAQGGCVSGRTFKRFGNAFYMLSPNYELYKWPDDVFVSKGRVKLNVNPINAKLACAEIVDNRYYYLAFKSGENESHDKYHLWIYDILGDRFYGPHKQFNVISLYYDDVSNKLLMGGADELAGFVGEHRGTDVKGEKMACHLVSSFSDFGYPQVEKRYVKGWIKCRQHGSLPSNEGQVEIIIDVDNRYDRPYTQRISLQDPANDPTHLMETGAVKEAVTKRFHIHEQFGRGNALGWQVKHEVLKGEFEFSQVDIEYYLKNYKKEDRGA